MGRTRARRKGLALGVAVTTAAAVVAGLASATTAGAAPASKKLSSGIDATGGSVSGKTDKSIGLPAGVPSKGTYSFLLKLGATPTSVTQRQALGRGTGAAAARSAARTQLTRVTSQQNSVVAALPKGSRVLYRSHAVLAGVAVRTDVANFAKLKSISGVTAVYPIAPKSLSNSYAVPLQKAPQAWEANGDLGANATVAIIDTGIDYTHSDFGGPGTLDAYNQAKSADDQTNPSLFPTAKVIGGYDLVGDDYNADPTSASYQPVPHPDVNPLDCNDHGSHVAGTVAGYGENSDGSTYTGAYNTDTPFGSMRIGPGIAPEAKLYAFRVFGCDGSTDVVGEAIDRAADPNNDGDTSDHVDVINMSLGSDFGSPQDGDSVVTNDASANLGITMAVASGNNGDLYDTGGSPGNAPRAIGVAATQDAQTIADALNVTAPAAARYAAERSVAYDWASGDDLSGDVVQVKEAGNLDGCDPLDETDAAAVNGHIAFVEWTDNDAERRCGSVARSANLVAAGATGFIFANDEEPFAAGITGSATIPGVLVAKSGGDAIRAQLEAGQTVTIGGTEANGFPQEFPELNDEVADFSSRGIRGAGNAKPDVAAVGGTVFSAGNGTGNEGLTESGTSMATPMVAGTAALVKSMHANWTPEQVKADIMNTADQDVFVGPNHTGAKFGPNRVGSGRIDVQAAVANDTLAYVTDDPGVVSASFGPIEVTADQTLTKTIKVQNTGLATRTYAVGYSSRTAIPGAVWSVSPSSVTVSPRSSATVTVTLTITKNQLTKTLDPTVERTSSGLPREFVADTSGLVTFTADGVPSLRVPTYAAPRPTSTMTQAASVTFPSGATSSVNLPLSGGRINQGSGTANVTSLVSGFELQASSPALPTCTATVTSNCVHYADEKSADLKYVGVTSSAPELDAIGEDPLTSPNGLAYFAINTHGPWRSPAGFQEFDIYIDSTGDGVADAVLYNTRITATDIFVSTLVDLGTGKSIDSYAINDRLGDTDSALFDSDTIVMPVAIGELPGVSATKSRISYSVLTFGPSGQVDSVGDVAGDGSLVGAMSFDVLHPGLALVGSYNGDTSPLLYADSAGTLLQLRRDSAAYAMDNGKGALIVHFHNKVGNKAQVVSVAKASTSVTASYSTTAPKLNKPVKISVTVAATGGVTPTGTVVLVRTSGGGAPVTYNPATTLVNGKATISYTPRGTGTYTYEVRYSGDVNFAPAKSKTQSLKITK